jgi:heme exporter protein D
MIPDLGKYAEAVLSAYGISVLLLAALVWLSLAQSARARKKLAEEENRHRKND